MKNIVLIGMMGCGKTSCGEILSRKLGLPLVDTDQVLQEREGCTISQLFAEKGEAYFRDRETQLIRELSAASGQIIATGGGLPLRAENRQLLRENGLVFFLYRTPEEIFDGTDLADRPLAQQGREDFIQRFHQREPLYRAAAHYVIAHPASPEQAADEILVYWKGET